MLFWFCVRRAILLQLLATIVTAQLPTTWAPYDMVTYFCQRWYHQSVVKNDTLFIHGGVQTFNVPQHQYDWTNNTLGYNWYLLQVPLSHSWDWKNDSAGNFTTLALEEQSNPQTGTPVRRAAVQGTMFQGPANDSRIYTYGGTTFRGNASFPDKSTAGDFLTIGHSDQYPLWALENNTQTWSQFDVGTDWIPAYGAAAEAPDQGLGFYLNGRIDNGSSMTTINFGAAQIPLNGMIVLDLVHHSANNISTTSMQDNQPRIAGAMAYVPGVGSNGVLAAMGGKVYDGMRIVNATVPSRVVNMSSIDIFDIGSYLAEPDKNGTWYSQSTSGDIPPGRTDFCTVVASAPDNSSHTIYIYGGKDPTTIPNTYYDDVYALSLPSFTWINIYSGKSPRWGHTCHLVGNRQMLTVGGNNKALNQCDWETKSVAIYDLTTEQWGSVYNHNAGDYLISDAISTKIGGSGNGGATKVEPNDGWVDPALQKIMSTKRSYTNGPIDSNGSSNATTPTGTPSSSQSTADKTPNIDSKTRSAIIAGATVAIVIVFACAGGLAFMYRRYHKNDAIPGGSANPNEISGDAKCELQEDGKAFAEAPGSGMAFEVPDSQVRVEADRGNAVTYAIELPATNFASEGRWGVPIIRVPTPTSMRSLRDTRSSSIGSRSFLGADTDPILGSSPRNPRRNSIRQQLRTAIHRVP